QRLGPVMHMRHALFEIFAHGVAFDRSLRCPLAPPSCPAKPGIHDFENAAAWRKVVDARERA
ncbi:hypothetical protein ACFOWB_25975, partial [Chenggangzhangella methanolivorans]|uniref:hypothetical protein n=1 Tax=Chenggangzhangella methanolivorans TaxID=1437009 RepID=UPI003607571D